MTFKEIQELLKFINKSNLTEFKLKEGDFELSIRTSKYNKTQLKGTALTPPTPVLSVPTVQQPYTPSSAPVTTPAPAPAPTSIPEKAQEQAPLNKGSESSGSNAYLEIKSPMVGTFYRSPSTDKPAYVKVGDQVEVGAVVCIVEAMKIFNEIESEISGKIVKVLVEDAQPVEFDQALFLVDPNG